MPKLGTKSISGGSGAAYEFGIYTAKTVFNDFIPGVFVVCKDDDVLCVGESDHVDNALARHEKKDEFTQLGANRICLLRIANPDKRRSAMEDLLKQVSPAL